jgi:hypothetical protein
MSKSRQLSLLRVEARSPVQLTPEAERELKHALAELLLAVARANKHDEQGKDRHERQDRE